MISNNLNTVCDILVIFSKAALLISLLEKQGIECKRQLPKRNDSPREP